MPSNDMANMGTNQIAKIRMSLSPTLTIDATASLPPIKAWNEIVLGQAIANAINASVSSNLVAIARVTDDGVVVSKELFQKFMASKQAKRVGDDSMNVTLKNKNRKMHV